MIIWHLLFGIMMWLVVGASSFGCEVMENLVLMGIGCSPSASIIVFDMDNVSNPNFSNQVLYQIDDLGRLKIASTSRALQKINPTAQDTFEIFDGVSKGKYTIGLGQDCMTLCSDLEDVISMSLIVVTSLLEKYCIDPKQIGHLEVGNETVIDKSKSIKTWLMSIFEKCGNTKIEGVDSTNACYGGTAALLNYVNWVKSNSWDGRYGLVVVIDSAVYAEGSAQPIAGETTIAMLIGPNAPLAFERKYRGTHMGHAYDFYKPNLANKYPVVDGKLSQNCYLMALDSCYK